MQGKFAECSHTILGTSGADLFIDMAIQNELIYNVKDEESSVGLFYLYGLGIIRGDE